MSNLENSSFACVQPEAHKEPPEHTAIEAARLEVAEKFFILLREHVCRRRRDGHLPQLSAIGLRALVLCEMLDRRHDSLARLAEEVGLTRAGLSRLAVYFNEHLGLRLIGQKPELRGRFSEIMKRVHEGTWTATPEATRRRERRRAAQLAETKTEGDRNAA